jgi:hypothetical protein
VPLGTTFPSRATTVFTADQGRWSRRAGEAARLKGGVNYQPVPDAKFFNDFSRARARARAQRLVSSPWWATLHRMALAVAEGAESVPDTTVRLRRIAELEEARKGLSAQDAYVWAQQEQAAIPVVMHDDLRWAHGIAWGRPTRYGNMSAQMKQFVDTTGGLWLKGEFLARIEQLIDQVLLGT